jgi:F0F1-type ATP synthase membrane subunit a
MKAAVRSILLGALVASSLLSASVLAAEPEESGLSRNAVEIARPFGFPITNSMVVSWVVALGLIVFAQLATRKMKLVPAGAQNLLEWLVEGLYGVLEGIIGRHLVDRTFWFFASVFIFILCAGRTPTSTKRSRWPWRSSRAGSSGRSRRWGRSGS